MNKLYLIAIMAITICVSACNSEDASLRGEVHDNTENKDLVSLPAESKPLPAEHLFIACQACHSIEVGADHKVGPNLFGIIDQAAASREGFSYSESLKNSGLIWNKSTLTGWILATETVVPGTWMTYHNHLSAEETTKLVEYIAGKK